VLFFKAGQFNENDYLTRVDSGSSTLTTLSYKSIKKKKEIKNNFIFYYHHVITNSDFKLFNILFKMYSTIFILVALTVTFFQYINIITSY